MPTVTFGRESDKLSFFTNDPMSTFAGVTGSSSISFVVIIIVKSGGAV